MARDKHLGMLTFCIVFSLSADESLYIWLKQSELLHFCYMIYCIGPNVRLPPPSIHPLLFNLLACLCVSGFEKRSNFVQLIDFE